MVSFKYIISAALVTTNAIAAPTLDRQATSKCGDVNIFFEGLPPYHPLVIAQGYDPAQVESALRADQAMILAAGYNLRGIFVGPEVDKNILSDRIRGINWDGTVIGFGVRGAAREDLTVEFEELLELFQEEIDGAPLMFNYSPNSTLWAIQRRFPILEDCTSAVGKDLGFEVVCEPGVCARSTI